MYHHNVICDRLANFIIKLNIDEEVLSDGLQGIFGPSEEPINRGV